VSAVAAGVPLLFHNSAPWTPSVAEKKSVPATLVGLPDMSGYDVAHRLREQPDSGSMRLVALSGYGSDGESDRSNEAGFEAHLVKPCRIEELEALLDRGG
jgi:CheY-like chemotaxis protein